MYIDKLTCVNCGTSYRDGEATTCPTCGPNEGILEVEFNISEAAKTLTRDELAKRPLNHWRYRELLPIDQKTKPVPFDIGWTPLIEAPRLAKALGVRRIRLKDDGRSASGSFKDRASSVCVTRALNEGASQIACASTGNAASSLAHCAAVAGIPANIFVSERIPEGKLAQLLAYGARVFKIKGTYDDAYQLCMEACETFGWYNRNAAINPYLVEGKKTGGLEIAEQCADDPPDWVSASVGDGCSIYGVYKGLRQLREVGVIDWETRILGVQAEGVAPIARAYKTGKLDIDNQGDTYADSINCPVPRNWRKGVWAVEKGNGAYITVSDDAIREAVRLTGRHAGIFAEPAAATAVAGIARAVANGTISSDASVVAVISANGLKDLAGAISAVDKPHVIPPDLGEVERIVAKENS